MHQVMKKNHRHKISQCFRWIYNFVLCRLYCYPGSIMQSVRRELDSHKFSINGYIICGPSGEKMDVLGPIFSDFQNFKMATKERWSKHWNILSMAPVGDQPSIYSNLNETLLPHSRTHTHKWGSENSPTGQASQWLEQSHHFRRSTGTSDAGFPSSHWWGLWTLDSSQLLW